MEERTVIHSTFVIERTYPVSPDRVFAAFADPAKKRKWFAEGDHHEVQHFAMDFRAGGRESASYRFREGTPLAGAILTHEGIFQDLVPGQRIVAASTMAIGGRTISAALATFEFRPSPTGTDLVFTHQAAFFEGSDGPQMREAGWRKIFDRLAAEVARESVPQNA